MNQELPDVQAGFRKGRETRDQIAKIHWIIEKAREFQKNIYFSFIDYTKVFDCVDIFTLILFTYNSVQFSRSVMSDSLWPHGLQHPRASLSFTNSRSLLKLMSIASVIPSHHFILCCPLLLQSLIFPSNRAFSNELVLHIRWPKYWSFSLSISPSNEDSGLISIRRDWLDLLAVQGTLKA